MATLIVPEVDLAVPTLGDQVAEFIEETCVFGPGSLQDQPAKLDPEKLGIVYRCYEVYPMGHRLEGRASSTDAPSKCEKAWPRPS